MSERDLPAFIIRSSEAKLQGAESPEEAAEYEAGRQQVLAALRAAESEANR